EVIGPDDGAVDRQPAVICRARARAVVSHQEAVIDGRISGAVEGSRVVGSDAGRRERPAVDDENLAVVGVGQTGAGDDVVGFFADVVGVFGPVAGPAGAAAGAVDLGVVVVGEAFIGK